MHELAKGVRRVSADWEIHILQTWRYTATYAMVFIKDKSRRLGQLLLKRDTGFT
jgi:hypothetical protein